MRYQVQVKHRFRATHSVPDDPKNAKPHTNKWEAVAVVEGALKVSPRWVMDWDDLEKLLAGILPSGSDLNNVHASGTLEAIGEVIVAYVSRRLPNGVSLVRLELHEADKHAVFVLLVPSGAGEAPCTE
jgi:6-pyruvoyl-tetrahydropterin synthase